MRSLCMLVQYIQKGIVDLEILFQPGTAPEGCFHEGGSRSIPILRMPLLYLDQWMYHVECTCLQ